MNLSKQTKATWLSKGFVCLLAVAGGLAFHLGAKIVYASETSAIEATARSDIAISFEQNYAAVGTALTVSAENLEEGDTLSYTWTSDGHILTGVTGNTYTPTEDDLESIIQVTATSQKYGTSREISMYCSELPVVYIDTEDGQDVIEKEQYKEAHLRLQGNQEFSDPSVLYDGVTEIKGRGNSTWDYAVANGLKKPYKLKLDEKADILGMGKNKHWVLLANAIDHTNMRNQLIYDFARDIGMECYMDSKPVVVLLNGEYLGMYLLCEHKRVDENRIDVFDWEGLGEDIASEIADQEDLSKDQKNALEEQMKTDFSWYDSGKVTFQGTSYQVEDYWEEEIPEFTGGFVFDMDFRLDDPKYISKFRTDYGYPMFFEAPEYAATSNTMFQYGKTYLQAFENAIHSDDFYSTFQGATYHYSQLFDIDSLLQNWFIVEYTMNWDGMKNSTLMYKDLDGPLKMGPAWDFDWCWGNINMYNNTTLYVMKGWHTTEESFCEQPYQRENWNRYLVSDPYFVTLAYEKWKEIREPIIGEMIRDGGKIDQLTKLYWTASKANDEKWSYSYPLYSGYGITNGQPTYKHSELYEDAVNSMKYFITERVKWMDQQFTSVEHLLTSLGRYQASSDLWIEDIEIPEQGGAMVSARITNSEADAISFYVNGIFMGSSPVESGEATLYIPQSAIREKKGALNTVQIRALDENEDFLKDAGKPISNYKNFQSDWSKPQADLTGKVVIQGITKVGSLLTALVTDTNNSGELQYQWFANGVEVPGAVNKTYLLTATDAGKQLSVKITSSVETGSLHSALTDPILGETTTDDTKPDTEKPSAEVPSGSVPSPESQVQSIRFSSRECLLAKGKKMRLSVIVTPQDCVLGGITWTTSDSSIVSVNTAGQIQAKKKGAAIITAKTQNGKTARVKIIVSDVRLKVSSIKMQKGTSTKLLGIKTKYPSSDRVASWKSSNKKVAAVNKNGKVTAKKKGTAKITVTMKSGAKASYRLTVTEKPIKTKKLKAVSKRQTMVLHSKKRLQLLRTPLTAKDQLTFKSSDPSVVKVSSRGILRAVGKGTASIRVRASSKASVVIKVQVRPSASRRK